MIVIVVISMVINDDNGRDNEGLLINSAVPQKLIIIYDKFICPMSHIPIENYLYGKL